MKRFLFALVTVAMAWVARPVSAAQHTNGAYVVTLNGNESPENLARQHGIGRQKTWTHAVHGFAAQLTGAQADRLEQDTRVAVIEPDVTVTNCAQTVPTGVRRIGCSNNAAWMASNVTPINADIAILDTGIDLTHPDLNVISNVTFIVGTTTGNDDNGHGTHCAGIAAALNNTIGVVGVAPGARLWSVKVLNYQGSGSLSTIISGVDYVTQHASEIEVASMSLGGQGNSGSLRAAIQNSVAQGVVYVVAAGNSGFEVYGGDDVFGTLDDFFPAAYPEVMTVSALADSDGLPGGAGPDCITSTGQNYGKDDTLATFSNYSKTVVSDNPVFSPGGAIDVAAPGVNIYSTCTNGTYKTMSGTSMACPHVSGAVALYIAANGRASTAAGVYAIRQAIINSAEPQTAWGINPTVPNPNNDPLPEGLVRVRDASVSTNYPAITLTSPVDGLRCTTTNQITFTATAIDATDGNLSPQIWWQSSQPGTGHFYTGSTITGTLTAGTHVISASVTNSGGYSDRKAITIYVGTPSVSTPTVTLTAPVNGTTYTSPVSCLASASDTLDGNITSRLRWSSSIDGVLGIGGSLMATLSPGNHSIIASVTNTAGLSGSASVQITVSGGVPPATNHPPIVMINYPVEGASFAEGTSVTVSSSASDQEDGDLTANIVVSDNINGSIGTGGSVLFFPSVGSHVLTASVRDSTNAVATTTRGFSVYARQVNTPPVVTITLPPNNWTVVSNTAVALHATATDAQDGTLVPSWYNSLSGLLGTGANFTNTFVTPGTNVVTATATDAGGLTTSANINVIVTNAAPLSAFPVVTITAPTNGLTITVGTAVAYAGSATDAEDGAIVPDWYDSVAGTLGSGTSGTYTPAVGTHRLTASATDTDGQVGSAAVTVQVNNANQLPTQLVVTVTCNKTGYVNKEKARITATVRTTTGVAVSGATCLFNVRGANGSVTTRTVTTTTAGTAAWALQINRSRMGPGVATVTCTASKTGSLNGTSTPVTFTVY